MRCLVRYSTTVVGASLGGVGLAGHCRLRTGSASCRLMFESS